MKILFLTESELEATIENFLEKVGNPVKCNVGFSENLDTDIIKLNKKGDNEEKILPVSQTFSWLNEYYGVNIKNYDVCEFGDFGEGFAFFF